jgi:hypothetical protein
MAKLNKYQQFEHLFPFYQMDVNGYIYRIKEALALEEPDKGTHVYLVKQVSLENLQKVFAPHASWNELNDKDSKFVKFLNTVAGEEIGKFNVFTLRVLSILWCEGSSKEKATEFYENL